MNFSDIMNFSVINKIIYWVVCFIGYWLIFSKSNLLNIFCKKEFNNITDIDDPNYTGGFIYVLCTPHELFRNFCEFYTTL